MYDVTKSIEGLSEVITIKKGMKNLSEQRINNLSYLL